MSDKINNYLQTKTLQVFLQVSLESYNRFTIGIRQISRIPELSTNKCHYLFPTGFPYRFTNGLRQVSDRFRWKSIKYLQRVLLQVSLLVSLQVYDRFTTGFWHSQIPISCCTNKNSRLVSLKVSPIFYDIFTTGFRQVSENINKYLLTNAATCFPTCFPTGLRQVYDRFPTHFRDVWLCDH